MYCNVINLQSVQQKGLPFFVLSFTSMLDQAWGGGGSRSDFYQLTPNGCAFFLF